MPWPLFTPGKDLVSIVQEAEWVPEPVWKSAANLASTCIRSPDRPALAQSLYQLSFPAHSLQYVTPKYNFTNGPNWTLIFSVYISKYMCYHIIDKQCIRVS